MRDARQRWIMWSRAVGNLGTPLAMQHRSRVNHVNRGGSLECRSVDGPYRRRFFYFIDQ